MTRALRRIVQVPPTALLGLVVVFAYGFVALFAHWIAPFGESEVVSSQ